MPYFYRQVSRRVSSTRSVKRCRDGGHHYGRNGRSFRVLISRSEGAVGDIRVRRTMVRGSAYRSAKGNGGRCAPRMFQQRVSGGEGKGAYHQSRGRLKRGNNKGDKDRYEGGSDTQGVTIRLLRDRRHSHRKDIGHYHGAHTNTTNSRMPFLRTYPSRRTTRTLNNGNTSLGEQPFATRERTHTSTWDAYNSFCPRGTRPFRFRRARGSALRLQGPQPKDRKNMSTRTMGYTTSRGGHYRPPGRKRRVKGPREQSGSFLGGATTVDVDRSRRGARGNGRGATNSSSRSSLRGGTRARPIPIVGDRVYFRGLFVGLRTKFFPFHLFQLEIRGLSSEGGP